jgi:outer membrane protein assembly factor BamB
MNRQAGSIPVIYDQVVYVVESGTASQDDDPDDRYLYAIDRVTGERVWKRKARPNESRLLIRDGRIYFVDIDHNLTVLDAADGALMWRRQAPGEVRGTPALHKGTLYLTCENHIHAIDVRTGKAVGEYSHEYHFTTPPFIMDDVLFVGSNGMFAFDIVE